MWCSPPQEDIAAQLGMREGHLSLVASCRRENIVLSRRPKSLESLIDVVSGHGPALVYTQTRKEVDELADELALRGPASDEAAVLRYHAGMSTSARTKAQERFLSSDAIDTVMVATNAFGMGIDKRDIRTIVHYGPPGTIENYYQELGRGGRDGKPTKAVLLISEKPAGDLYLHRFFVDTEHPTPDDVYRIWKAVLSLGTEEVARRPTSLIELPDVPNDLLVSCSVVELQAAAMRVPHQGGSAMLPRRKVQAVSKCVRVLAEWGYLERVESRTTISFFHAGGGDGGGDGELQLPPSVRAKTMQAKAWLALAAQAGLTGAARAAAASSDAPADDTDGTATPAEVLRREVHSETFDGWGRSAGLEPTQFANAVRALGDKGLIRVQRSPAVQIRVPGDARTEDGQQLPDPKDERVGTLLDRRKHREDKIKAMEKYMAFRAGELGEDEDLWRFIMRYFGEAPAAGA